MTALHKDRADVGPVAEKVATHWSERSCLAKAEQEFGQAVPTVFDKYAEHFYKTPFADKVSEAQKGFEELAGASMAPTTPPDLSTAVDGPANGPNNPAHPTAIETSSGSAPTPAPA